MSPVAEITILFQEWTVKKNPYERYAYLDKILS